MIFEHHVVNIVNMKKIAFFLLVLFLFSTCTTTKEISNSGVESRNSKKLAEQAEIKKAVEARRFIIKVNRLYAGSATFELIPTSNFVIVNGDIASISVGYIGSSLGIRRITGINLNGHTQTYKMESNEAKGVYKIQMAVTYGTDKFDVYLTIGNKGYCNISINNAYIQSVNYSGTLVPIPDSKDVQLEKGDRL